MPRNSSHSALVAALLRDEKNDNKRAKASNSTPVKLIELMSDESSSDGSSPVEKKYAK